MSWAFDPDKNKRQFVNGPSLSPSIAIIRDAVFLGNVNSEHS
jgi:hypothetical protein